MSANVSTQPTMKAVISLTYHIEVDLSNGCYPPGCDTPERRLQHEIEKAECDPLTYAGNRAPVVNGMVASRLESEFSEPY